MAKRFQVRRIVFALAALVAAEVGCANSEPIEPRTDDPTSGAAGTFGIAGFTGGGVAGSSGTSGSKSSTGAAGTGSSITTSGQAGDSGGSGSAGTGGSAISGAAGSGGAGGGGTGGGAAGRGGSFGFGGRGGAGGRGGSGGRGGAVGTAGTSGSPDAGANPDGGAAATFTDIYMNVLVVYCGGATCHNPGLAASISFASKADAYDSISLRVLPGNGTASAFYMTVNSGRMPRGAAKLSAANLAKIKSWIDAGALDN